MSTNARVLIGIYVLAFAFIAVCNTPYVEYVYNTNDYVFTGERGTIGLTGFNELTEQATKENGRLTAYYIDFQFLITELIALTVVFVGFYKIYK